MSDYDKWRVSQLVREAFRGITLGDGVGLHQGRGLDDYADKATLEKLRATDEKVDWSRIPLAELNKYGDSLSFMDGAGMRFHLPAYMIAELADTLTTELDFHLFYSGPGGLSRFDLLSVEQRRAVREYLLLRLDRSEFTRPMIQEALDSYWVEG